MFGMYVCKYVCYVMICMYVMVCMYVVYVCSFMLCIYFLLCMYVMYACTARMYVADATYVCVIMCVYKDSLSKKTVKSKHGTNKR